MDPQEKAKSELAELAHLTAQAAAWAPSQREKAGNDLSVARLTARADLVLEELARTIAELADLLRRGASDAGQAD